MPFRN